MLIIPVLLTVIEKFVTLENEEFVHLFINVIDKLDDENSSVSKTSRRLLLELQKMFPEVIRAVFEEKLSLELQMKVSEILEYEIKENPKLLNSDLEFENVIYSQTP